jgi:transposase-like protein
MWALKDLKADQVLPRTKEFRQGKYLNNLIEQEHQLMNYPAASGRGIRIKKELTAHLYAA